MPYSDFFMYMYKFSKYTTSACLPEECIGHWGWGRPAFSTDTNTICSVCWEKGFLAASFTNHKQKWWKRHCSDRTEMFFFLSLSLVYQAPVFKFNITAVFCWETCGGPNAANVPPPHGWGRAGWWLERAVASADVQGLILWCINCRLPHVQLIKGEHSKGQKEKYSDEVAIFTSNAFSAQKRTPRV